MNSNIHRHEDTLAVHALETSGAYINKSVAGKSIISLDSSSFNTHIFRINHVRDIIDCS